MNLTTAFEKFIERTGHSSLPWQTSRDEMLDIFTSGWLAHAESLKHADDLFPGTLGHLPLGGGEDYTSANVAQLVEQIPCKDKVVGSIPSVGSITAEDIYAAYPRKVGKQAAIKAIKKVIRAGKKNEDWMCEQMGAIDIDNDRPMEGPTVEAVLLERTKAYAAAVATWPAADKQFIPHPATWFNRGSYDDDPKEWVRGAAATPSQFTKKYE